MKVEPGSGSVETSTPSFSRAAVTLKSGGSKTSLRVCAVARTAKAPSGRRFLIFMSEDDLDISRYYIMSLGGSTVTVVVSSSIALCQIDITEMCR